MKNLFMCMAVLAPVSMLMAQETAPITPSPAPAATAAAVAPDTVVLKVGDDEMTAAEFNAFISALPEQVQAMAAGPGKRILADRIVELKLLSNEARRSGLDKEMKSKMAVELAVDQTLAQIMAEAAAKSGDDTALKAEYDKDPSKFDQIKARHILIRTPDSEMPANPMKKALTEDEAKAKAADIHKRVTDKPADFADIAKAESDDTGSGQRGGELGVFAKGMMVPFEDAAFALKAGETSQPVKTKYGWHIIQAEERTPSTFEEVKERSAAQQGGQNVEKLVKKLKESQNVKLDDSFFGPANAMPAGHP